MRIPFIVAAYLYALFAAARPFFSSFIAACFFAHGAQAGTLSATQSFAIDALNVSLPAPGGGGRETSANRTLTFSGFDASLGVLQKANFSLSPTGAGGGSVSFTSGQSGQALMEGYQRNLIQVQGATPFTRINNYVGISTECWNGCTRNIPPISLTYDVGTLDSVVNTPVSVYFRSAAGISMTVFSGLPTASGSVRIQPQSYDLTATYEYVAHAAPTFGSADTSATSLLLDFGIVELGDASTFEFDVFNQSGTRASMRFLQLLGGTEPFSVSAGATGELFAGDRMLWSASFNPTTVGTFETTYSLIFGDASGAASTRSNNLGLQLTVRGTAIASPVPEPSVWLMLLPSVCLVARRQRNFKRLAARAA